MDIVFANTFPGGLPKTTVTSVTLVNNTLKTLDVTVPNDTFWLLQMVKVTNCDDVQRGTGISLYTTSGKTVLIGTLAYIALAAADSLHWPSTVVTGNQSRNSNPLLLAPGMTISVTWEAGGASAGGTDADGFVIFYRELPIA